MNFERMEKENNRISSYLDHHKQYFNASILVSKQRAEADDERL
jgi:hypothetical protein